MILIRGVFFGFVGVGVVVVPMILICGILVFVGVGGMVSPNLSPEKSLTTCFFSLFFFFFIMNTFFIRTPF